MPSDPLTKLYTLILTITTTKLSLFFEDPQQKLSSKIVSWSELITIMHNTDIRQTSDQHLFEAESIGNISWDLFSIDQDGYVMGNSSRGVFIKISSKWMSFISYEPYRGPLTINLGGVDKVLQGLIRGMSLRIASGKLVFPDAGIEISVQDSEIWGSQSPRGLPLPESERSERLVYLAKRIMDNKKEAGLAPLLPILLRFSSPHRLEAKDLSPFQEKILHLQREIISTAQPPSAEIVISLLGYGSGLTPSGDDFVIGLLLALNRWQDVLFPTYRFQKLNSQVIDDAYQKTTTLSANLIECATLGLADERLIDALDWLMGENSPESPPVEGILGWGDSSGIDVFTGFVVALTIPGNPTQSET